MCFEDRRRRNREELICECREVRFDRDWDNRNRFANNRDVELRCCCRESNRRNFNRGW